MARLRLVLAAAAALSLCFNVAVIRGGALDDNDVEIDAGNIPPLAHSVPELVVHPHTTDDHPLPLSADDEDPATAAETTKPVVLNIPDEKPFSPPELTNNEQYNLYEPFRTSDLLGKSWYLSTAKKDNVEEALAKYDGEWKIEEAKQAHLKSDLGLVVKSKARHHAIATRLEKPFTFAENDEPLVVQFDLKFQEGQDCGGGYVKLLSGGQDDDLNHFMDKTPFTIMFGPDKCGLDSKLHLIVKLQSPLTGELEEKKASQPPKDRFEKFITDKMSHLYTLVLQPDQKFTIYIDQKSVHSGSLLKDFEPPINPPKQIKDPNAVKPSEWDDREQIPDETEVKPESWIEDRLIPDPKAEKPEDWDDEMDGVWEAPKIDNPSFKGDWRPKQIKNPSYSGVWKQPMIENPTYFENNKPFQSLAPIFAIGIELWTMSADIMFDNFLITNSKSLADRLAKETWSLKAAREKYSSAGDGITATTTATLSSWYDYAKNKPWVLALFVLGLGIPIAFIIMSLTKRSRESSSSKNINDDDDRNRTNLSRENAQRRVDKNSDEEEDEDDDELIGGRSSSSTGQNLLRTPSPLSSSRSATTTTTTQRTTTQQRKATTDDSQPPELESEGSEVDENKNVNGDEDDGDYENEDEELLTDSRGKVMGVNEPINEAGDNTSKANKNAPSLDGQNEKGTTEAFMPGKAGGGDDIHNSAMSEGGTTNSNLRSRTGRRARREE